MLLAASKSTSSQRGLLFPPTGHNSSSGGDCRRGTKKSILTKLEVFEKFGERRGDILKKVYEKVSENY